MKLQQTILLIAVLAVVVLFVLLVFGYTIDTVKIKPGVVEVDVSPPDESAIGGGRAEENQTVPPVPTNTSFSQGIATATTAATMPPPATIMPSAGTPRILFENVRSDTNGDGKINLDDNRALMMTDTNGSQFIPLTDGSSNTRDASWSPDGKTIVFASNVDGDFDIYTMSTEQGPRIPIFGDDRFEDRGPSWSPDGQWIAFYSDRDGDSEIYLMRPDGSDLRQLTFNDIEDEYPTWHPNANQIAYQSGPDCPARDCRIYQMSLDGQGPELYLDLISFWPSWSPDGRFFGASVITTKNQANIHTWDMASENKIVLDDASSTGQNWSPDSSQMAYVMWGNSGPQIWIMNSDGSNPRRLTSGGYNTRPVFSP